MKKINERSTVALDDAIFNFAEALTHILAVNLSMLYDDVDNDEDSTIDFDEEAEKHTINVYKFAAGADGKVGKDEIFTCQCLAHQFNSDDSRSRYYNYLAEDLGAHLERIWLECEDEDAFVDAATQLLRGLVAAAQFTDAGRLDGGEKRKMLNQINKLVEAYVLAGGGMGVNENTKVTLTFKQLKRLVKESKPWPKDIEYDDEEIDVVDDEGPADVDAAVKDLFDMYRACKVEPKVCNAIKADGEKTNIFLGRGNSVGGIAKRFAMAGCSK